MKYIAEKSEPYIGMVRDDFVAELPGWQCWDPLHDEDGNVVGMWLRRWSPNGFGTKPELKREEPVFEFGIATIVE